MKNFRKFITAALAAAAAVSAMSMTAMAASDTNDDSKNAYSGMIDTKIYDSDMVYVPEHAEIAKQYNESLTKTRATRSYSQWNWSNGMYSATIGSVGSWAIPYYFVPTSNYLYFNIEVNNCAKAPELAVNKYLSDGTLDYVGSYSITSVGSNSYAWSNKKRSLNAGTKYVFSLLNTTNWKTASIDINKVSFD